MVAKRDVQSRGGSRYIHDELKVGAVLKMSEPRNNFRLCEADHSVFIAGGIGITPIRCMIGHLESVGASWELHMAVRRRDEALFLSEFGSSVRLHVDEEAGEALNVGPIVHKAPTASHFYCCGPAPMLEAFKRAAAGRPSEMIHIEYFNAPDVLGSEGEFTVELRRSGMKIKVCAGQSILEALRVSGVNTYSSCEQGVCGACETRVISGRPEHRDFILTDQEKEKGDVMMICCSGSASDCLVLDL